MQTHGIIHSHFLSTDESFIYTLLTDELPNRRLVQITRVT